jgi:hypothetical protein
MGDDDGYPDFDDLCDALNRNYVSTTVVDMDTLLVARDRAVHLGLLNRRLGHAPRNNTRVECLEIPLAIINDMQDHPDVREIELLLEFVRHSESLRIFRLQDHVGHSSVPGYSPSPWIDAVARTTITLRSFAWSTSSI